ncbi:hypothetical protein [Kitasatospora sp. NPDC088783]|uniref:hypothetical protein n=1 Tax=Kitasatospora sp. NPDC088783 TaxID=3364077 RepID=UPI00382C4095
MSDRRSAATPGDLRRAVERAARRSANTPPALRPAADGPARLTLHARGRAAELGFPVDEVLACASEPEVTYGGNQGNPHERVHQRGSCAVVYNFATGSVVTVLLRTESDWEHGLHTRHNMPS